MSKKKITYCPNDTTAVMCSKRCKCDIDTWGDTGADILIKELLAVPEEAYKVNPESST